MITTSFYRAAKGCFTQSILLPSMSLCSKALTAQNVVKESFPVLSVIGTTVALACLAHRWITDEKSAKTIDKILNEDAGLATDYLEEGYGNDEEESTVAATEAEEETVVQHTKRGVARLDHTRVDVTQHRRVRTNKHMQYMNCVMSEIKGKFGTPTHNEANRKAVQRFANSLMMRHGLRPTHIRQYLPMLVDLSFVPSESEVESMRVLGSGASASTRIKYLLDCCAGGHPSTC